MFARVGSAALHAARNQVRAFPKFGAYSMERR